MRDFVKDIVKVFVFTFLFTFFGFIVFIAYITYSHPKPVIIVSSIFTVLLILSHIIQ